MGIVLVGSFDTVLGGIIVLQFLLLLFHEVYHKNTNVLNILLTFMYHPIIAINNKCFHKLSERPRFKSLIWFFLIWFNYITLFFVKSFVDHFVLPNFVLFFDSILVSALFHYVWSSIGSIPVNRLSPQYFSYSYVQFSIQYILSMISSAFSFWEAGFIPLLYLDYHVYQVYILDHLPWNTATTYVTAKTITARKNTTPTRRRSIRN